MTVLPQVLPSGRIHPHSHVRLRTQVLAQRTLTDAMNALPQPTDQKAGGSNPSRRTQAPPVKLLVTVFRPVCLVSVHAAASDLLRDSLSISRATSASVTLYKPLIGNTNFPRSAAFLSSLTSHKRSVCQPKNCRKGLPLRSFRHSDFRPAKQITPISIWEQWWSRATATVVEAVGRSWLAP